MQTSPVRWGVLGTARIADAVVRGIRESGNSELVAIASREPGRAQGWAAEREVPHVFGSYDEMLLSDKIDAVYIPLPNALHKEWTIRAAQSHKHILCEKPLATNAADAQEMAAAAESNHVTLMEAFMYRFHPQTARLRELVLDGAVGEPRIIRARFGFLLQKPGDVRWDKDLGGGSLLDVGCYCVNLTRMIAGAEPVSVTASGAWSPDGVDLSVVGTLEFAGGLLGAIDCSFQTGTDMHQWFGVSGTMGMLSTDYPFRMSDDPQTIELSKTDRTLDADKLTVPGGNEYAYMVRHFADALLKGEPVGYPPSESIKNMRVLDALREAAQSGHRVELEGI